LCELEGLLVSIVSFRGLEENIHQGLGGVFVIDGTSINGERTWKY
jgi:hypothetical protein